MANFDNLQHNFQNIYASFPKNDVCFFNIQKVQASLIFSNNSCKLEMFRSK